MNYEHLPTTESDNTVVDVPMKKGEIYIRVEGDYQENNSACISPSVMDNDGEVYWEISGIIDFWERLSNPCYGSAKLNDNFLELAKKALPIEKVWEITGRLPSLNDFLSNGRDTNE